MRWNQKYDSKKMFSLVDEYLEGGITQTALCDREGLKKGTFKYWQRKYREESKKSRSKKSSKKVSSTDFIPISVPTVDVTSDIELDFYYPNGVRLELSLILDTECLSVVKTLVSCLD